MLLFVRSFVRVFVRSFVRLFVCLFVRSFVRSYVLVETDFWIMPRSSEARLVVSEARFEVSVASQPTAGARIFGPIGP